MGWRSRFRISVLERSIDMCIRVAFASRSGWILSMSLRVRAGEICEYGGLVYSMFGVVEQVSCIIDTFLDFA